MIDVLKARKKELEEDLCTGRNSKLNQKLINENIELTEKMINIIKAGGVVGVRYPTKQEISDRVEAIKKMGRNRWYKSFLGEV